MIRSGLGALLLCLLFVSFTPSSARANSGELLNFQGLGDMQPVGNFYNGAGISGTPVYGVSFSSNFYGLTLMYNGGAGDFSATPSGTPAIFVGGTLGAASVGTMNTFNGFSSGLNFFYSAGFKGNQTETVTIWSGADGTGIVLGSITLTNNNGSCTAPAYCNWSTAGITFTGTAHSVTFSGPANEIGFADLTLGSNTTAVPEPESMYLLATGLVGISLGGLKRLFS